MTKTMLPALSALILLAACSRAGEASNDEAVKTEASVPAAQDDDNDSASPAPAKAKDDHPHDGSEGAEHKH